MELVLYCFARAVIALLQALPLAVVARLGRCLGALVYWCDARHRRVAIKNLTMCFGGELSPEKIKALALENFRRIGENYASSAKTASMGPDELENHREVVGAGKILRQPEGKAPASRIIAIGHFGNFEIFASAFPTITEYRCATTYRALPGPRLNKLLLLLRRRSGCLFFERRTEGAALRVALRHDRLLLGLLSDQHTYNDAVRLPFLGHDCGTTKAPAIFARRFNAPLHTAICYRTRVGHWRIEIGDEIPIYENGRPRPVADVMLDINRAFEAAVRRDPANWFWVHNRWKPARKPEAKPLPPPP